MTILTVTTGPETKNLVELDTVKDELGISDSSQNSKLSRLISMVSAAFAGTHGLRREPWRQTYEEQLPGRGGIYLRLSRWPVESISSVDENGTTVTATDYSIAGAERSKVYREDGWNFTPVNLPRGGSGSGDEDLDYTVDYVAGWLMPGTVNDWKASKAYASGDWVRSTDLGDVLLFECTSAGTSDSSEPTWPTDAEDTVVDNGATWTARAAQELPEDIHNSAIIQVNDWFRGSLNLPAGIAEKRTGDVSVKYDVEAIRSGLILLPAVKAVLEGYR